MRELCLLALQTFQVLFLWVHDWVPLGRLNDVAAVKSQDSTGRLIVVTLIQSAPFTVGLVGCLVYFRQAYPGWLHEWLWISYAVLFVGQMRAWWVPYLFRAEPGRAEPGRADRYRVMFGRTHSFLPVRNGIAPNTAHILLHIATLGTLVLLFL